MKISGVYKITNIITGDFYIGSSKDVKHRWALHKIPYTWKKYPNNPMYLDFQKYGVDKFDFQILEEVEIEKLKETEQKFIEKLKPTYNSIRAKGFNIDKYKEYQKEYMKEYNKSDKHKEYQKEYMKEYMKEYRKSDKYKEHQKKYRKSEKYKEYIKGYHNQLCLYNGEIIKLNTLAMRFYRAGIEHYTIEAKKYIIKN